MADNPPNFSQEQAAEDMRLYQAYMHYRVKGFRLGSLTPEQEKLMAELLRNPEKLNKLRQAIERTKSPAYGRAMEQRASMEAAKRSTGEEKPASTQRAPLPASAEQTPDVSQPDYVLLYSSLMEFMQTHKHVEGLDEPTKRWVELMAAKQLKSKTDKGKSPRR